MRVGDDKMRPQIGRSFAAHKEVGVVTDMRERRELTQGRDDDMRHVAVLFTAAAVLAARSYQGTVDDLVEGTIEEVGDH
jgi:hypothetical protein